ncbi:uncharacterized protein BDW43DRAFT_285539 [Aspergillus alliaceus]|uniref:uncharacterized protein n=1 Tax=Petromyces alliaceus TaxID=209559 RepID=UPI0012A6D949|nr:uncharacterized protein BDW43DRAFT_285539 [Aspergillus alliaceus]KAB8230488.1 hypothetical protein BDW43DRAFT_285539 [Aspergillus alliaceus]
MRKKNINVKYRVIDRRSPLWKERETERVQSRPGRTYGCICCTKVTPRQLSIVSTTGCPCPSPLGSNVRALYSPFSKPYFLQKCRNDGHRNMMVHSRARMGDCKYPPQGVSLKRNQSEKFTNASNFTGTNYRVVGPLTNSMPSVSPRPQRQLTAGPDEEPPKEPLRNSLAAIRLQ